MEISLNNYSMLNVDTDSSIRAELNDYFSFFVPGHRFMPAFRNKVWDGKIRLYNQITGELNAGLYPYVAQFCLERNYKFSIKETDYGIPGQAGDISNLSFEGLKLEPYDYQKKAVEHALQKTRGILLSPTGSGKSYIIYLLIKYFLSLKSPQKVLIIVPTTSLVEQMYNDFAEYGMIVESACHKIYSGKDKNTNKKIIISTWQSIYKNTRKWFADFGMIIGDECHGFKAKSLSSIMNKSTEAKYRFGTTGTLDGTQTHKLVLEGLFGPVYKVTTTKKLQDSKTLAALNISVLVLKYNNEIKKSVKELSYQDEIDFLISNEKRNTFIRNLAIDQKGNTLVLFQRVANHGKILFDIIDKKADNNRKVFFVSGQTDTSDREAIRKIVEKQSNAIIVASLGTFSTGINIRNLHSIIFASPSKSQIRVLQSIGRGLRQSDDGRDTKLYDIADDLSWKGRKNFTLMHSAERIKIYTNEQFNFKRYDIEFN